MLLGLNMRRTLASIDLYKKKIEIQDRQVLYFRPVRDERPRCWQEETETLLKGLRFPTQPSPLKMDIPSEYDFTVPL
jgi:hypothetical protein